ncbi:MAG: glycogen/starch synthase [Candidatus Gottesmanbacteria bacterium]
MKILYCASEVSPIIKVGGLGDVAGSLPKALADLGVEISVIVPKYEEVKKLDIKIWKLGEINIDFANKKEKVIVWETKLPGSNVSVYLIENDTHLSKDGHQAFRGTEEEIERFAFFSKSIATILNSPFAIQNFSPDLLHLNDWHTSLIPLLLECQKKNIPSLLTIHNLSYQGLGGVEILKKLGISADTCQVLKWDAVNKDIDILMEGIIHADYINAVSPTYAKEIMTREFGEGIEDILKGKEGRATGILNGIDMDTWNPEKDKNIKFQYSSSNFEPGKSINKKELQNELGLEVNENIPVIAYIGRIEPKQKGLDIIYEAIEELFKNEMKAVELQFVLLGTGDKDWEEKFSALSSQLPANIKFINRFDEKLAHQIYAGADIMLVPSKFEPCGLPQMIAMRYGALPLVRKVGGLADTVRDNFNGFVFKDYSGQVLMEKIAEALKLWGNKEKRAEMIERAMKTDFSWDKSAKEYLELYKKILTSKNSE